ncbi:uncharacterized protein LOC144643378 [Oculina patagonica]
MCDDLSYDNGNEAKGETSRGNQRRNGHVESEVPRAQCENNGVARRLFNNKEEKLETFENFAELHDRELFQLHKLTAWEERCREFSSNAAMPLRQKLRLGCAVESNGSDEDESNIMQSLGSRSSSPAGHMNGKSQQNKTTNSATESKPIPQSYARLKNQRRKERKSSLCALSVLPPLVEEKYHSSPSPVIRRHTIGSFEERDRFEVPEIVLSKVEDECKDTEMLKLPKIEPTKSGHLQIPLSSSDPHRLAPPSLLGPFKAFRPPARERLGDKSTMGNVRLPQLRTRDDKKETEKTENPGR